MAVTLSTWSSCVTHVFKACVGMIRGLVISLVGLVAGHRGIGNGTVDLIKFMKTLFSNAN